MNSRTISTPSIPQAKRAYAGVWPLGAAALLALIVISVIVLWQAFAAGQAVAPVLAPLSGDRFLAQNPELSVAARYGAAQDATRFLARNPELIVAARYAAAITLVEDSASFLHRNPELSAAARYGVLQDEASFRARNPEVSAARRYAIQQAGD